MFFCFLISLSRIVLYFKLEVMISTKTTINATNTPSTIQSFFRLRINLLNIKSDIKKTIAESKDSQASIGVISMCCGRGACLLMNNNTLATRHIDDTILSGVSLTFTACYFLNFFVFQAGCLFVLFRAAAAMAAACFFS